MPNPFDSPAYRPGGGNYVPGPQGIGMALQNQANQLAQNQQQQQAQSGLAGILGNLQMKGPGMDLLTGKTQIGGGSYVPGGGPTGGRWGQPSPDQLRDTQSGPWRGGMQGGQQPFDPGRSIGGPMGPVDLAKIKQVQAALANPQLAGPLFQAGGDTQSGPWRGGMQGGQQPFDPGRSIGGPMGPVDLAKIKQVQAALANPQLAGPLFQAGGGGDSVSTAIEQAGGGGQYGPAISGLRGVLGAQPPANPPGGGTAGFRPKTPAQQKILARQDLMQRAQRGY